MFTSFCSLINTPEVQKRKLSDWLWAVREVLSRVLQGCQRGRSIPTSRKMHHEFVTRGEARKEPSPITVLL